MAESRSGFFRFPPCNPAVGSVAVVPTVFLDRIFGCRLTFFGIKTKAPMIPASSGGGIVPIPTKHEMDLLEKDTKPKGWWMRERILFCVQRDTTVLSLCCGLVQPMCKPEGRSIPSLRELTVQIASCQRAWKKWGWSHRVWYYWSCSDWALQSLL